MSESDVQHLFEISEQQLRAEIAELKSLLAEQQIMIGNLTAELEARDAELEARDEAVVNESETDTVDDANMVFQTLSELLEYADRTPLADWPRGPHTAATYALQQTIGTRKDRAKDFRPLKDAFVLNTGKTYERRAIANGPFYVHVGRYAVVDCTFARSCWIACKDDAAGNDQDLMARNLRRYDGTPPGSLYGWPEWAKTAYLSTHDIDPATGHIPPGMYAYGGSIGVG